MNATIKAAVRAAAESTARAYGIRQAVRAAAAATVSKYSAKGAA